MNTTRYPALDLARSVLVLGGGAWPSESVGERRVMRIGELAELADIGGPPWPAIMVLDPGQPIGGEQRRLIAAKVRGGARVIARLDAALPLGYYPGLFYLSGPGLDGPAALAVLASAPPVDEPRDVMVRLAANDPAGVDTISASNKRLALASDAAAVAGALEESAVQLTGADWARCWFHDADDGAIWSELDGRDAVSPTGLVGWVARTGRSVALADVIGDPRFVAALDDRDDLQPRSLLVTPVRRASGATTAIVVVGWRSGFAAMDGATCRLEALAAVSAAHLERISIDREIHDATGANGVGAAAAAREPSGGRRSPFGEPLRLTPSWSLPVYGLLAAALSFTIAYLGLVVRDRYAVGSGVIRVQGRRELRAMAAGVVEEIYVAPGEWIVAGTAVARLDEQEQRRRAGLARARHDDELRRRLESNGVSDDEAMRAARRTLVEAELELESRVVRAPVDGVVGDLRVASGEPVMVGDTVVTLEERSPSSEVIAFFAGSSRQELALSTPLAVELIGVPGARVTIPTTAIDDEVVGPDEAARYLGTQLAGALRMEGPLVLVRARLPPGAFDLAHVERQYDGQPVRVEARVRSESLFSSLFDVEESP